MAVRSYCTSVLTVGDAGPLQVPVELLVSVPEVLQCGLVHVRTGPGRRGPTSADWQDRGRAGAGVCRITLRTHVPAEQSLFMRPARESKQSFIISATAALTGHSSLDSQRRHRWVDMMLMSGCRKGVRSWR